MQACCKNSEVRQEQVDCLTLLTEEDPSAFECRDCFCPLMKRYLKDMCAYVIERVDPMCMYPDYF